MLTATCDLDRPAGWWTTLMATLAGAVAPRGRDHPPACARRTAMSESADRLFLVVVDDTEEMQAALLYACTRAAATNGRVALLRVVEPAGYRYFSGAHALMRAEALEAADHLLCRLAGDAEAVSGRRPLLFVREGEPCRELIRLVGEEAGIATLVLAAHPGPRGPGPLVTAFSGKYSGTLPVPLTIVPGHLTRRQTEACA